MRFEDVHLAGLAPLLPEEIVTSEQLEQRLAPLYQRLRLRVGRLELMTGIRERRRWPPGTRPSAIASRAAELALARARVPRESIGLLIHASVCRDFLEPATATVVHAQLGLAAHCPAFDLSNACLGFVHALTVAAAALERGDCSAALVVAGEDGGPLVEATLAELSGRGGGDGAAARDAAADKAALRAAFASLTIGSGAAAAVLTRGGPGPRLVGGHLRAATEFNHLCRGDQAPGASGPQMETDSEALLVAGCALAAQTWGEFLAAVGWSRAEVDRVITHQVGVAHRRTLLAALGLDPSRDFPTVETLGNMGSVSLPATLGLALEAGFVGPGQRVGLLGIGSGLQCLMVGLET
jgi:3-oxoacyl-[acyl-carrier-protein] synthase III